ncbi:MAG: HPr family phosphocarrier protein [Oscillospiraceae bacterium]|nr:HPr family phosphocarrier protein [Oscillospiraceae bacterium]
MTEKKVKIATINDVKAFVSTVMMYEYDVDLISGRYAVDAKSIMGLFSLDLTNDLVLKVHSNDCGDLINDLAPFIV